MPIHDWTRVEAGRFRNFHLIWLGQLTLALNGGVLPTGYYAETDQHVELFIPDIIALRTGTTVVAPTVTSTLAPAVATTVRPAERPTRRPPLRWINVRHSSHHEVVALIEVVSPANKDRRLHVNQLADKIGGLLARGVASVVVDLFPPGRPDPGGIHGAVWSRFDRRRFHPAADTPLMLASYRWDADREEPVAYLEPTAVGRPLTPMPLFLPDGRFVNVPLEETYQQAYRGVAEVWRQVLDAPAGGTA